ncbi:xanthine dehydrogenase family protein subunit M [[Phormidium] sp. ETS-05]|uniref:FAD binding domain-containing protein n=1 Tax=[Phormidium] sp. ETS-05 TaxID=222819 RepID=UPI0018EEF6B2|nr:FAD binding domain-containing protein [[Phormidium] sp. ETS-05]
MIPVQFDYAAPESLEAAVKLLQENQTAQVLAGGYSVIQELKQGGSRPSLVVDLRKISGLKGITKAADGSIRIGAMTTYDQAATAADLQTYGAFSTAVGSIGDQQVRNWNAVGDATAYRDLACDLAAAALALEAKFSLTGPGGTRVLTADEFLVAPLGTALAPGEIVSAIILPPLAGRSSSAYQRFIHPASRYTICGIAAAVSLGPDGNVSSCRVAFASARSTVVLLPAAGAALTGKAPTPENIAAAAKAAGDSAVSEAATGDNLSRLMAQYAGSEYRAHLRSVLTERALTQAVAGL